MAKQQKLTVEIPKGIAPSDREAIGREIVEHIRQRTEAGKGVKNGRLYSFPGYSKEYTKSLDFKNAGKSKGEVNLTLSGDMLAAFDVLSTGPGRITIGFEAGTEENDRAEGNILGSYGGDPNSKKARNFLGITDAELRMILRKFDL